MKDSLYKCFSQKQCSYLMSNGFILITMRPDLKNPNKNVFLFKNSDELQSVLKDYKK